MRFVRCGFAQFLVIVSCLLWSGQVFALNGSGAEWGARDPGRCNSLEIETAPTPDQVVEMLRCKHEVALATGELWLMENIQVSVGKATPFVEAYGDYVMDDGDTESTAYNIRGSFTWAVCKTKVDAAKYGDADLNCYEQDVPEAKGVCWKTTFGDYRCRFVGSVAATRPSTSPPQ
jgi:hypothetical protein